MEREAKMREWASLALRSLCTVLAVTVIASVATAQGGGDPDADSSAKARVNRTRTALEKWVETRGLISAEKRDLALKKEMLEERIALVEGQTRTLQERTAETEKKIAAAATTRAELLETKSEKETAATTLKATVAKLEQRTKALLVRLPEWARERVKPFSQQIPENPDEAKASLGERFSYVVGILAALDKMNREITVTSEVRSVDENTSIEVTALYVGLGQGYYVDAKNTVAGVGTSTEDGWVWTPANDAAERIAKAVAISQGDAAAFVPLPVRIK